MNPVVRFAPSPTGNLHIGNARTALFNWLFALKAGGQFILRFDDTDRERSREEFVEGIRRDLDWLGIVPHREERQSLRADAYVAAGENLRAKGVLYPCYETPADLERKRKRQAGRGQPPVYDRAALRLTAEERAGLEAQGRKPHWRFLLPNHDGDPSAPRRAEIHWDDLVRGTQTVDLASMSDPVLVREDGTWPYTLSSVVDDIDFGITHVIRGDDHVTNTGAQIALFQALGATHPAFGHHNLLTTASGEGLSKRLGSLSLHSLAEAGYEPMAVASLAVLTGAAGSVDAVSDMAALAARLDLSAVSKSAAKFDPADLDTLNAKLIRQTDWADIEARFAADEFEGRGEELWLAVRENIVRVMEMRDWWRRVIATTPERPATDLDYLRIARELLPAGETDAQTWSLWTVAIRERTGRKGRELFQPLRKALTGMEHGPEMARLLPVIGRERILARLP